MPQDQIDFLAYRLLLHPIKQGIGKNARRKRTSKMRVSGTPTNAFDKPKTLPSCFPLSPINLASSASDPNHNRYWTALTYLRVPSTRTPLVFSKDYKQYQAVKLNCFVPVFAPATLFEDGARRKNELLPAPPISISGTVKLWHEIHLSQPSKLQWRVYQ